MLEVDIGNLEKLQKLENIGKGWQQLEAVGKTKGRRKHVADSQTASHFITHSLLESNIDRKRRISDSSFLIGADISLLTSVNAVR